MEMDTGKFRNLQDSGTCNRYVSGRKKISILSPVQPPHALTINEPVDYMARAIMILMRGKDIMRAIGRVGP